MRYLVDLPYKASTNKYEKFFPYPLLLLKIKKEGDILLDLNLKCRGMKDIEIKKELDNAIKKLSNLNDEIIISCGHFPADADKTQYFDYFIKRGQNINLKIMGIYPTVNPKKTKSIMSNKHEIIKTDFDIENVELTKEIIEEYPRVGKKLRASIRISMGCPRKCLICPTQLIYNQLYKFWDIEKMIERIKLYYSYGVRYITFIDDNLSCDQKKFVEFLKRLKDENLKGMSYLCQEGFEVLAFHNDELCQLIKDLKFVDVKLAIENIKTDFLKKIGKYYTDFSVVEKALVNIKKYNIDVGLYLLIGLDSSEKDIIDNIKFITDNNFDVRINIVRPYENNLIEKTKINFTDKQLQKYRALGYAASWYKRNLGINIFAIDATDKIKSNYTVTEGKTIKITGRINFGFMTSKFLTGLRYLYDAKSIKIHNKSNTIELIKKPKSIFDRK